jgi:hypothetical protein
MRLAIGRISDGEFEYAKDICSFVRDIYRELTLLVPLMDDTTSIPDYRAITHFETNFDL